MSDRGSGHWGQERRSDPASTRWEPSGGRPRRSVSAEGFLSLVELALSIVLSAAVGLKYLSDRLAERSFDEESPGGAPFPVLPPEFRNPDAFTWSDYIPVAIVAGVCVLLTFVCAVLALWPADGTAPRPFRLWSVRLLLILGVVAICVLLALLPSVFR